MAKLQAALGTQEVVFLGRSEPFDYKAGVIEGTQFPAGTAVRCIVGTDALDYQELKVKGTDFANVWPKLREFGRGVMCRITYRPPAPGRPAELVDIAPVAKG